MGYQVLPDILWRKQSNKPNKFMGSGMLPPNAYVTLEHEYILIFRKGETENLKNKLKKSIEEVAHTSGKKEITGFPMFGKMLKELLKK